MVRKPDFCRACPINHLTGDAYVPLKLVNGESIVVGEAAGEEEAKNGVGFCGGAGQWLRNLTRKAGVDFERLSLLNVIGCRPPGNVFPGDQKWTQTSKEVARAGVEYCKAQHMWPALKKAQKKKIFAIGAHALEALTTRSGIHTWRGSPLPCKDGSSSVVLPTIHPAALMRQAKLASVVVGDFKKSPRVPPERYNLFPSLEEVRAFKSPTFAFDFEWDSSGNITLCGLSDKFYSAIVVPFTGEYIYILKGIFEQAQGLIGHNIINADMAWFERLGWKLRDDVVIHDTMLKQHLVQPDFPHDLGFVASVFTNKVFWKGKGWEEEDESGDIQPGGQQWRTWDRPQAIPRELGGYGGCKTANEAFRLYNARDTDAEYQINLPLGTKLRQYELENTYWNVSVPVAYICRDLGEAGFKIDTSRLGEVRGEIDKKIQDLESQLPEALKPRSEMVSCNNPAPPGTFRPKVKTCRGAKSKGLSQIPQYHPSVEITFTSMEDRECPTCGRLISPGKMVPAKILKGTKESIITPYNSPQQIQEYVKQLKLGEVRDSKTGNPTTGKRARKIWAKEHPEFILLGALKEQITLRNNFAKDSLLGQERMYFNLKVHGTSEGRLSSSGRRRGIDLNIQNQPEEFRIIYVPDQPGWGILNLDICQGENMLTTWIAQDWERWERINTQGYDEHCDLASRIFARAITKSKEDKPWRDIGKKINHGRNYGMGVKKQLDSLIEEGFDSFTQADVKEFIEIWRTMNPRTAQWQGEVIQTVERQGWLRNAFGRRRWFSSRSAATEGLAFLPASTLADMVLRMMIAHYPSRFQKNIEALHLKVYQEIVGDWRMATQVHDSLVFMGPHQGYKDQAERSKMIMEQSWEELDNFRFKVDAKYSQVSWGDVKEIKI
jgi:uracil-DNA glycosylase family 4